MIDPGCPCPDYERLELAHDLLAAAMRNIVLAMDDAEVWESTREPADAAQVEVHRVLAIKAAIDGAARLAEAGQNLAPLDECERAKNLDSDGWTQ